MTHYVDTIYPQFDSVFSDGYFGHVFEDADDVAFWNSSMHTDCILRMAATMIRLLGYTPELYPAHLQVRSVINIDWSKVDLPEKFFYTADTSNTTWTVTAAGTAGYHDWRAATQAPTMTYHTVPIVVAPDSTTVVETPAFTKVFKCEFNEP